jgi:hypothetical protein
MATSLRQNGESSSDARKIKSGNATPADDAKSRLDAGATAAVSFVKNVQP